MPSSDPFLHAAFPLSNRLLRLLWSIANTLLVRPSPRPFHAWRRLILSLFGAKVGRHAHIYPKAVIWAPWNLVCDEFASIADEAVVYNPKVVHLCSHAVVSQQAYICGATHDYEDPNFPLISLPINLGPHSWICARATVQSGVNVGEGAVLALGSVATRDLDPWTVYGGIPARRIKSRSRQCHSEFTHAPLHEAR